MRISGWRNDPDFPPNPEKIAVWFDGTLVPGHLVLSADDASGELLLAATDAKGDVVFGPNSGELVVERKTGRVEISVGGSRC